MPEDSTLWPDPFPYGAEIVLAQYVLKQELKDTEVSIEKTATYLMSKLMTRDTRA